tara:strand:- start:2077 stop:2859 length:783 start_codon:yes stop_codon:yes gene_type:complete
MIKIHSVDKDSKVLFEDGKGGGRSGTKQECESYGYKHNGTDCYSFRNTKVKTNKDNQNFGKSNVVIGKHNTVIGRGNRLHSSNNIAIGSHNLVSSSNGGGCIVMGKNAYSENPKEFAISMSETPERAKYSTYQYDGVTTDVNATELFLGGYNLKRLAFDISNRYEYAVLIEYTATALNPAENLMWSNYGHAAFRFCGGVLTEVSHAKGTALRDSHLNYDIEFAAINSTASDYIELKVEGANGDTAYWNVILNVTEVKVKL